MSDALSVLPPLGEVVRRHGLNARKSLGQHFLFDLNLTRRIARAAAPLAGHTVIEIGPGPGGLTRALVESDAARIVAVERDRRCVAALQDLVAASRGRLAIVTGDALGCDVAGLGPAPRKIVANLPYNAGTPMVLDWLRRPDAIAGMTLMFQKEVAARLAAAPGTKAWGRLGVAAQWRWAVRAAFDIPPAAFVPPPQVISTVVTFAPRPPGTYPQADPATLERVVAAAFGQRRKMLRASLRPLLGDPVPVLAAAGIDPTRRAEDLSVAAFCALARAVSGA